MKILRQSTAVTLSLGPFVSSADGWTAQTGLVGTGANQLENTSTGIRISKNGASKAARHATAAASTSEGDGHYLVVFDTTDSNTLGPLKISMVGTATLVPFFDTWIVVPANVYDSLVPGSDLLMVDIAAINNVSADAALLSAMVECGLIGTVTATGADATHLQFSDITEATGAHYVGKEAWVFSSATLSKQRLGIVTAYALTGGQGRMTFSGGSPSNETAAVGDKVYFV